LLIVVDSISFQLTISQLPISDDVLGGGRGAGGARTWRGEVARRGDVELGLSLEVALQDEIGDGALWQVEFGFGESGWWRFGWWFLFGAGTARPLHGH